jgi:hypothetical protein
MHREVDDVQPHRLASLLLAALPSPKPHMAERHARAFRMKHGRACGLKEHDLMTRSILSGMLGLISVLAVGALPTACQSGGVGDPCTPEDEYNTDFAGFKVTEENIESRSFQCQTRICLVNHFQGRVSCPFGQTNPPPAFDSAKGCQNAESDNFNGLSDAEKTAKIAAESEKPCCVPGTDTVINAEVCGQCAGNTNRNHNQAVYCSCRCGVADGEPDDPNFNFCECPDSYECAQIRPNVGLGDKQLTGKYCILKGTAFKDEADCSNIQGHLNPLQCKGTPGIQ